MRTKPKPTTTTTFKVGDIVELTQRSGAEPEVKVGGIYKISKIIRDEIKFEGISQNFGFSFNWVRHAPSGSKLTKTKTSLSPNHHDPMQILQTYIQSSTNVPAQSGSSQELKFKVGDAVVIIPHDVVAGTGGERYIGKKGVVHKVDTADTTLPYCVKFSGNNDYWFGASGVVLATPQKPKQIKVDLTQLDKLVIAPDVREEIIGVLSQASKSKTIFEDWGLGETIKYGRGMGMLFHGPAGTGKTWAANCIAQATGQELLSITVAQIQSSEPGAANRNLENAFKTAKENNNVLFIDECDGLITDRSTTGMILSGEINTLLTEIEKFEGICILATNRIDTLDPALERRLALIVEFPKPSKDQRKQIWQTLIPKKFPLDKSVTIDALAEHKLTGGFIKNVLIAAARLAASKGDKTVTLDHFTRAIERVEKSEGLMGTRSVPRQVTQSDYQVTRDIARG